MASLISQLGYIGLEVSDMAAWKGLARDVLGCAVGDADGEGVVALRVDEYQQRIRLHPGPADDLVYAGWEAPTLEAYEEARRRVQAAGFVWKDGTEAEVRARSVRAMTAFEIHGLPMEIYYGPSISREKPLNLGRPVSGFKTGAGGLGHVVVTSQDLEGTVAFFRDQLGFLVSDYIWNITFLHCNSRHHSLAVEPPAEDRKRLAHLMLEVISLDDVGHAWDLVRSTGTPFKKTIGRHSNDLMVSFYLTTPSGFDIEYGWGGLEIDDSTWTVSAHAAASVWGHERSAGVQAQKGKG